ncbi:hypothetical protein AAF712_003318 [Marasmius tenuissimus]|uniref:acylaminoacyl-peptidase n=1 Tax=Marasmius tenuissimus TaxID=585030 RepID=A0ABR3A6R4_9AGAR
MTSTLYDRLAELPAPISGYFVDRNVVQLSSSIQDFTRNTKRSVSKSIFISANSVFSSPNQEAGDTVLSRPSPSGKLRVNLKEIGSDDKKKRFVEVWSKESIVASKEVTEVHGAFYNDDYLSTISFSDTENSVVYIAEEKNEQSKDTPDYYRYSQSFGEGFPGKKRPAIFVFLWDSRGQNTQKTAVIRISTNTPHILFGQALFSSKANVLFATGYEHSLGGRLLGVKGCYNRPSGIWQISLEKDALSRAFVADTIPSSVDSQLLKLTPPHLSCRSPRLVFNEGRERLVWLAVSSGGAHASTSQLHSLDITSEVNYDSSRIVVDVVNDLKDGEFPGLYPDPALSPSPFVRIRGHDYLITHSALASYYVILLISLDDGTIRNLTPTSSASSLYSSFLLNTDGERRFICVRTSPTVPYEVILGEIDDNANVSWQELQTTLSELPTEIQHQLAQLKVDTIRVPDRHPVETIVIQHTNPEAGKIPPHIMMPHGGPHATSLVGFNPANVAFALAGFNISLPNYTGSLGFGETHVRQLLGKCGTLDVEDCIGSLRHLTELGIAKDGQKAFLFGGSHGGFLIGHLLAQYPDTFAAACLRNPVTSCGEVTNTDIRDWYWGEFGHEYSLPSSPIGSDGRTGNASQPKDIGIMTPALYEALFKAAPIGHVEKVKAGVLLCVGGSDKRVSPTQGIDYYHALKAARAKAGLPDDDVEMLWFPDDGHPLEGVEASRMTWVRSVEWFKDRL